MGGERSKEIMVRVQRPPGAAELVVPLSELGRHGFIDEAFVESVGADPSGGSKITNALVWISWRNTFRSGQPETVTNDSDLYYIRTGEYWKLTREQYFDWQAANRGQIGNTAPQSASYLDDEELVHMLVWLSDAAAIGEVGFPADIENAKQSFSEFINSLRPSDNLPIISDR